MKTEMFFSLLIATLLVLAGWEAQAQGIVKKVNCAKGQTITHALQRSDPIPITIQVKGTCNENVEIVRDDITLIADPSGGIVNGVDPNKDTISVSAARAVIDGLTVTGGRTGISVSGSGGSRIRNCTVRNNGWNGIAFYHGGHGLVDNCTVQNNGLYYGVLVEGASATVINSTISSDTAGIVVHLGGSARIGITDFNQYAENTISTNQGSGILISNGGSATIGGNTITGNGTNPNSLVGQTGVFIYNASAELVGNNKISGNSGGGVLAVGSRVQIGNPAYGLPTTGAFANVITGNANSGIVGLSGASLWIEGATVTGNANGGISGDSGASLWIQDATINENSGNGVTVLLRSTAWMFGNTINNNTGNGIWLILGGSLLLQDPAVEVTGNTLFGLQCLGNEDRFAGNTSGISGNIGGDVSPSCKGF